MLIRCWADVVDGGPTSTQHWFNVSFLLGCPVEFSVCIQLKLELPIQFPASNNEKYCIL